MDSIIVGAALYAVGAFITYGVVFGMLQRQFAVTAPQNTRGDRLVSAGIAALWPLGLPCWLAGAQPRRSFWMKPAWLPIRGEARYREIALSEGQNAANFARRMEEADG